MKRLISSSILLAGLALASAAVAQQPLRDTVGEAPAPAPQAAYPAPDAGPRGESPGIPGPEAVNPAPGMHGPYIGAGEHNFYDVDARIAAVSQRVQQLPRAQRRSANAQIRQIKAEEATQRARHGDLRDWDRENLNARLDKLVQAYPGLQAGMDPSAPPPGQ